MITMTRRIREAVVSDPDFADEIAQAGIRFYRHDWGNLDPEDIKANNQSLPAGGQILGAYPTRKGTIWMLADPGHPGDLTQATITIMFPNEY